MEGLDEENSDQPQRVSLLFYIADERVRLICRLFTGPTQPNLSLQSDENGFLQITGAIQPEDNTKAVWGCEKLDS